MTYEGWNLALAALAGAILGALFFGALWWTVRTLPASPRPGRLMLGSLLLRVGGAVAGIYLVAGSQWQRLAACLLGFLLARTLALRLARDTCPQETKRHAP